MYIKSDFEEIILKLATYGQREKAFPLSSKFCPQGIVCPGPGPIYLCIKKHEDIYQDQVSGELFQDHWSSGFFCLNDGYMFWGFALFSEVFRSHQDDGRVHMKASVL